MKKYLAVVFLLLAAAGLCGCGAKAPSAPTATAAPVLVGPEATPNARMEWIQPPTKASEVFCALPGEPARFSEEQCSLIIAVSMADGDALEWGEDVVPQYGKWYTQETSAYQIMRDDIHLSVLKERNTGEVPYYEFCTMPIHAYGVASPVPWTLWQVCAVTGEILSYDHVSYWPCLIYETSRTYADTNDDGKIPAPQPTHPPKSAPQEELTSLEEFCAESAGRPERFDSAQRWLMAAVLFARGDCIEWREKLPGGLGAGYLVGNDRNGKGVPALCVVPINDAVSETEEVFIFRAVNVEDGEEWPWRVLLSAADGRAWYGDEKGVLWPPRYGPPQKSER